MGLYFDVQWLNKYPLNLCRYVVKLKLLLLQLPTQTFKLYSMLSIFCMLKDGLLTGEKNPTKMQISVKEMKLFGPKAEDRGIQSEKCMEKSEKVGRRQ